MTIELVWENCECDWCGSSESTTIFSGPDLLLQRPGNFTMVRCIQCGLIRQNPRLTWESLSAYYPEEYSAYEPIIQQEKSIFKLLDRRYGMEKRIRAIRKYKSGGKLLDVGCGTGIFLGEVQRNGNWEICGVEPVATAADYVRNVLGCEVFQTPFLNAGLKENQFDVLTMWNVLEHLYNPIANTQYAYNLLKPGGVLVISIPNVESLENKIFRQYWLGWDLPRHLYLFPQKQIEIMLSEIGFQVKEYLCIAGSHHALGLSLNFLLKSQSVINAAWQNKLLKIYHSIPSRILLSPLFWAMGKFKNCSLLTIIAQKTM